jgi:hypothetical protein
MARRIRNYAPAKPLIRRGEDRALRHAAEEDRAADLRRRITEAMRREQERKRK